MRVIIALLIKLKRFSQTNLWNNLINLIMAISSFKSHIEQSLYDLRFVGICEIGLDFFVAGLDPQHQEQFFHAQLDLAQQFQLPVILHVCRSQGAMKALLRWSSLMANKLQPPLAP